MRRSLQMLLSQLAAGSLLAAATTVTQANQAGTTFMKIYRSHG